MQTSRAAPQAATSVNTVLWRLYLSLVAFFVFFFALGGVLFANDSGYVAWATIAGVCAYVLLYRTLNTLMHCDGFRTDHPGVIGRIFRNKRLNLSLCVIPVVNILWIALLMVNAGLRNLDRTGDVGDHRATIVSTTAYCLLSLPLSYWFFHRFPNLLYLVYFVLLALAIPMRLNKRLLFLSLYCLVLTIALPVVLTFPLFALPEHSWVIVLMTAYGCWQFELCQIFWRMEKKGGEKAP